MSMDSLIFDALKGLVASRVYPDVAPEKAGKPYITYQQVGGVAVNFVDPTIPGKKNGRYQISIWGKTRLEVAALASSVENTLRVVTALQTHIMSAPVSMYELETKLYGTRQDFSFWL